MVFLLGINFDERLLVRKALTSLFGISKTSTSFVKHRGPSTLPVLSVAAASSSPKSSTSTSTSSSSSSSSTSSSAAAAASSSSSPSSPSSSTTSSSLSSTETQQPSTSNVPEDQQTQQQQQQQQQQRQEHPRATARHSLLAQLLAQHHIHPNARLREVPEPTLVELTAALSELTIESELKRKVLQNIERLREMNCYRGRRHAFNLPVRGQRTRTQITTARKMNFVERRL